MLLAFPLGVLAAHQFDDVPNSNIFHNDIDALVDYGVTSGCDANSYCPNAFVTRGQMAAFLNRLGALQAGKTPVVNADRVDGVQMVDLIPGGDPPLGMTIRGAWALNGAVLTWAGYSFGYELSQAPTPHFIPAGAASPAGCPGTATNPEADPGHLCVYEDADSVGGNPNFDCVFDPLGSTCSTANRRGFGISQSAGGGGAWFSGGTWAVTEPLTIIFPISDEPQPGDGRSPFGTSQ
jgi:hypothetical protein